MKVIRPDFWNRFQCIGGVCSDNCCIGWEICIDEESLEKYRQVEGAIGERLKTSIRETDGESSFCTDCLHQKCESGAEVPKKPQQTSLAV